MRNVITCHEVTGTCPNNNRVVRIALRPLKAFWSILGVEGMTMHAAELQRRREDIQSDEIEIRRWHRILLCQKEERR